ncbi:MAG: LLM class flavin-dependent oxidoreductase [bacterium]|nr:LLM class flavin-dependent oxidoreductase [bacterium]
MTNLASPPQFSLFLPQMRMDMGTIEERVKSAEACGFHKIDLMDHLNPPLLPAAPMYDAFVMAAAAAAWTERVRIGHMVLCGQFRHPALLAKMIVSVDHFSGGRFDLGIGWGSVPDELERFGLGDEPPAVRAARLRETLEVVQALLTGEPVNYQGRFFQMENAQQQPTPLNGHIPILIGGAGRKLTMPLVRDFADWWNCPVYGMHELDELIPLAGNARLSVQRAVGLAPSSGARDEVVATAQRRFGDWALVAGTPDEVAEGLQADREMGAEQFVLQFSDFASPETLELFAAEVIPAVT